MNAQQMPSNWRKSRLSAKALTCVEVGELPNGRAIRDSKNPAAGHLSLTPSQWSAFHTAVTTGRFERQ